jgi:hypothetical protein
LIEPTLERLQRTIHLQDESLGGRKTAQAIRTGGAADRTWSARQDAGCPEARQYSG